MPPSDDRDSDAMNRPKGDSSGANDNVFVKFKQVVDSNLSSLLHGVLGIPSAVSRSTGARPLNAVDEVLRKLQEADARPKFQAQQPDDDNDNPNDEMARGHLDLPLYSSPTPSLFATLFANARCQAADSHELGTITLTPSGPSIRPAVRIVFQCLMYTQLQSNAYRLDASLLPYLLFSPYSPIILSVSDGAPTSQSDKFPYADAFEDLIASGQKPVGTGRLSESPSHPSLHPQSIDFKPGLNEGEYAFMGEHWCQKLHKNELLYQSPHKASGSPFNDQDFYEEQSHKENNLSEEDMYNKFMQWSSDAENGSIASMMREATSSTESHAGAVRKNMGSNKESAGLDIMAELLALAEPRFAQERERVARAQEVSRQPSQISDQRSENPSTSESKSPDSERVVMSNRSVSHTTHGNGTIETTVREYKKFADGRETETETVTSHSEEYVFNRLPVTRDDNKKDGETGKPAESSAGQPPEEKIQAAKKGWFWR